MLKDMAKILNIKSSDYTIDESCFQLVRLKKNSAYVWLQTFVDDFVSHVRPIVVIEQGRRD